ncbi:MAG: PepSY-like domain-containing protein [Alistipes sp.]|jgi:hypothetical protein|nr:PepSY-like domain-containing protein [Alistipes sp.]
MKKVILLLCAAAISTPLLADGDKPVEVSQLPAPAREFIDRHFGDVRVALATVEREMFDGTTYEVFFTDGRHVEFDGSGRWTSVDCSRDRVPEGIVPEAILRHIAANYPGRHVTEIDRDRRDYEVQLDRGLELTFDMQFRLIGMDD